MTNDYAAAFGRLMIATVFVLSGLGKIAAPAVTQYSPSGLMAPVPPAALPQFSQPGAVPLSDPLGLGLTKTASPAFPASGGETVVEIDNLGDLLVLSPDGSVIDLGPAPLG